MNTLNGTKEPTLTNKYLARDGLYYNGYCFSTDCAEDSFKEATEKICEILEKEIWKFYYEHGNGD